MSLRENKQVAFSHGKHVMLRHRELAGMTPDLRVVIRLARWCARFGLIVVLMQLLPAVAQQPSFEPSPNVLATLSVSAGEPPAPLKALGEQLFAKTVFDGDWYSHALHLGLHIDGQAGTVTISNSPNVKVGSPALYLQNIVRAYRPPYLGQPNQGGPQIMLPWFDGAQVHVDGSSFPVQGRLTPNGELLLMPKSGFIPRYTWKMQRVTDPTKAASETCATSSGTFDGVWYSPELRYGIQVCNGSSRFTLPPRRPWVQRPLEPLKIVSQSGAAFDGSFAQTNARVVNVHATRTIGGHIQMQLVGRPGIVTWVAVGGQNAVPSDAASSVQGVASSEISIRDRMRRHLAAVPSIPQYAYATATPFDQIATLAVGVGTSWLRGGNLQDHYNEFYFAAVDYRLMALRSLHRAQLAMQEGDHRKATSYIDSSDRYLKEFYLCVDGARAVYAGDLDGAADIAAAIYTGSKVSAKFTAALVPGPWASRLVDGIFMTADFIVDSSSLSSSEADRNLALSAIEQVALHYIKIPSLGNRTISDAIAAPTRKLIGSSGVYPILVEAFGAPEFTKEVMSVLGRSGAHFSSEAVSLSVDAVLRELVPPK